MKRCVGKTFSVVFIFALIIVGVSSNVFGWSWRDLKINITTEEELLMLGGFPYEVVLSARNYLELKQGKTPAHVIFRYCDSEIQRKSALKSLYDPTTKPILSGAPLPISKEVWKIEMMAHIDYGKLSGFYYFFNFLTGFDKKKYIGIFDVILGKPIQMETMKEGEIVILYENDYELFIEDLKIGLSKVK